MCYCCLLKSIPKDPYIYTDKHCKDCVSCLGIRFSVPMFDISLLKSQCKCETLILYELIVCHYLNPEKYMTQWKSILSNESGKLITKLNWDVFSSMIFFYESLKLFETYMSWVLIFELTFKVK